MQIKNMFKDDINRKINGVIQVEQEEIDVIEQEVKEYVVTKELKKNFQSFFNIYRESFDTPTDNVGAWITGFFGSGKSHFLKMLSYLLENREIKGKKVSDYFRDKFDDALLMLDVDNATKFETETILFNIDSEGSSQKDATAVLKVFTKVFYNHLGYYGRDTKVAKLEQFIDKQGKLNEFKSAFEEENGDSWENSRADYYFWEDSIISAMVKVLGVSEKSATHWFDGTESPDVTIEQLVGEIKEYVDSKGKNFRLLFMIDEAGQYMSTDTSLLLNMQTIIEKLGSVCRGKVWVVATGQEALDDMLKGRHDEFSRIMARFPIRITLTSTSAGEVIEKRLLTKTDEADKVLNQVYNNNDTILKNLYAFDTEVKDIRGFNSQMEFERVYPFVPYQFVIMPKIFNEVRLHGHVGAHESKGERTMLSGFQQSAQSVQYDNELTIVPLYKFYNTLHSSLTDSVRSVVERAQKAAQDDHGLAEYDVNLLKLLYLLRYIDDFKANIENITILMADNISVDKLKLKEKIRESLDRLNKNNYVARNGDVYVFLTNEEQDIEREINNQVIDSASVISEVAKQIFDDIELYPVKKYRYKKIDQDFEFDKSVDSQNYGLTTGGMKLRFITLAAEDKSNIKLTMDSKDNEAICRLNPDYNYFEKIEKSLKIKKYCSQKHVDQLPKSIQDIISSKNNEKQNLEKEAKEEIKKAIMTGDFFVDGEKMSFQGASVRALLDRVMETLVDHTYKYLSQIDTKYNSENEIKDILTGHGDAYFVGQEPNLEAIDTLYKYLQAQNDNKMSITIRDIHDRYQKIPYGWKEFDIMAVIAQLVYDQKVTIKYSGQTIQPNDHRMVGLLRKKSESGNVQIKIRENIPTYKINNAVNTLRDYFEVTSVPKDEDGLVSFITSSFDSQRAELTDMKSKNQSNAHPGINEINNALDLVNKILLSKSDNLALIDKVNELSDDLLDSSDDMQAVRNFYKTQIKLYDDAVKQLYSVENDDRDFLFDNVIVKQQIDIISDVTSLKTNRFNYSRIPELNDCISKINDERTATEKDLKADIEELVKQCINEIELKAQGNAKLDEALQKGKALLNQRFNEANNIHQLSLLKVKQNTIASDKDSIIAHMDKILNDKQPEQPKPKNRRVKTLQRQVVFNSAVLDSEEKIDEYLSQMKTKLCNYLNDCDEIEIR